MKHEFSAGGIVYKHADGKTRILLCQHSYHKGWVFPKGLIGDEDKNETKEETAVREVKEETGITAKIVKPLSKINYWYQFQGEKRKKTVYYFIMEHTGGNTDIRDDEMQAVEWLPKDKVLSRLTYKGDRKIFKQALPFIRSPKTKNC